MYAGSALGPKKDDSAVPPTGSHQLGMERVKCNVSARLLILVNPSHRLDRIARVPRIEVNASVRRARGHQGAVGTDVAPNAVALDSVALEPLLPAVAHVSAIAPFILQNSRTHFTLYLLSL